MSESSVGIIFQAVFTICIIILFYSYFGYGILLYLVNGLNKKNKPEVFSWKQDLPTVAFIIAAYNEGPCIREKLMNSLSILYPHGQLHIYLVTDGSTDETVQVGNSIPGITVFHHPDRRGKLAAIQRVLPMIEEEVLVFSDANCLVNPECLEKMIPHFRNPKVGAVAAEKKVQSGPGAAESLEGLYWKYESWLKSQDWQYYSIVGAAGELFAIRKSAYTLLETQIILDDFVQSIEVCRRGLLVAYEKHAWSAEKPSLSLKEEFERKTRISAGGYQAMHRFRELLTFQENPRLSFQYLSHRVLRWTACPPALVFLLLSSICLVIIFPHNPFWKISLVLQVIFYGLAAAGWVIYSRRNMPQILNIPLYFTMMNLAVFRGAIRYYKGNQQVTWKKAGRRAI